MVFMSGAVVLWGGARGEGEEQLLGSRRGQASVWYGQW